MQQKFVKSEERLIGNIGKIMGSSTVKILTYQSSVQGIRFF